MIDKVVFKKEYDDNWSIADQAKKWRLSESSIVFYRKKFGLTNGKKRVRVVKWIVEDNGCWRCVSHAADSSGYPRMMDGVRRNIRVSKVMYERKNGRYDASLVIRHKCDNSF